MRGTGSGQGRETGLMAAEGRLAAVGEARARGARCEGCLGAREGQRRLRGELVEGPCPAGMSLWMETLQGWSGQTLPSSAKGRYLDSIIPNVYQRHCPRSSKVNTVNVSTMSIMQNVTYS